MSERARALGPRPVTRNFLSVGRRELDIHRPNQSDNHQEAEQSRSVRNALSQWIANVLKGGTLRIGMRTKGSWWGTQWEIFDFFQVH